MSPTNFFADREKESMHSRLLGPRILWIVKNVFRDLYTNTTSRKKDVMHEAWHNILDGDKPENYSHEDLVDASEDYKKALKQMYLTKKSYFELLVDFRTMEAIAKERHVSPQAINEQKKHARQMLKSFMDAAA
jgi:hypothetical protein